MTLLKALLNLGVFMTEQLAIQSKLRDQLLEYQNKNPAYSLRSFARKLQISPSSLSEILSGKRRVSKNLAQKILSRLGADPNDQDKILSLFDYSTNANDSAKKDGTTGLSSRSYLELSSDQFQILSQWYHFAILSLAETKGFVADPLWISHRLGIKLPDAERALERLHRLGLAVWTRSKKTLTLTHRQLSTTDEIASTAVRQSHNEDLKLASEALDQVAVEDRDFTSITIAIDKNKLPRAKKMIREFQNQLAAFLETGNQTEVYKFCFYAFPLSQSLSQNSNPTKEVL